MDSSTTSHALNFRLDEVGVREAAWLLLAITLFTALVKQLNKTDIPKIKNLPEIPGIPMFGSLILLGRHHARECGKLARKYGEVFQARLGNRVRILLILS